MSESYKPSFKDGDEIKFIEELWEYFIKSGWYTNPKNDICDFILYLFDKYDKERFFTKNTLAQNERLLKMTATKIKSVKKNISIKFMNFDEYEKIFKEALENLIKKDNIKDENDEYYKIIIENPVERFALENDLKKFSNDTLEYGANSDISFIKKTSFFKLLVFKAKDNMKIDDFKKELENNNMQKDIKKSFENIFDSLTPKSIHIPIKEGFKIIRAFLKSQ